MSHRYPEMTFGDRAYRREKMVAAYREGHSSRHVAHLFGVSDSYVRSIMRDEGIARRPGAKRTRGVAGNGPSSWLATSENANNWTPTFSERSA